MNWANFTIDTIAPTIQIGIAGSSNSSVSGYWDWYEGVFNIPDAYAQVTDSGSGIALIEQRINGGPWQTYTTGTLLDPGTGNDGTFTYEIRAIDRVGHTATASKTIHVDRSIPAASAKLNNADPHPGYTGPVKLELNASDGTTGSGIRQIIYMNFGREMPVTYTGPVTFTADGTYNITYYSLDNAGNSETQRLTPDRQFETIYTHWANFTIKNPGPILPGNDYRPTYNPIQPTPTPEPSFQEDINGYSVSVSGNQITAQQGVDLTKIIKDGRVTLPAGEGTITLDVNIGSQKNRATITGVHVNDQSTGTLRSGPASVSVTADLDGLPSASVSFSATISDPPLERARGYGEWLAGRGREIAGTPLAEIDIVKTGFTNTDIVSGTAKITLTVKKPAGFSRTKPYTVIRHGDDGYEELTATYRARPSIRSLFKYCRRTGSRCSCWPRRPPQRRRRRQ